MNKQTLKGQWHQARGWVKERWGKLTDDDLEKIEGDVEQLIGRVQKEYGLTREEAEHQVNDWMAGVQASPTRPS